MIYACDHCHFLFSRMSPIERCPDCGKESIRPATPKEAQEFEGRKSSDRIVTLFIAMSLDGYVADSGGKVDWLQGENSGENDMAGYQKFIKDVDTVLMGWNTYHQVTTELSPGGWAYADLTSYVLTHRALPSTDAVRFVSEDVCALVRRLKGTQGVRRAEYRPAAAAGGAHRQVSHLHHSHPPGGRAPPVRHAGRRVRPASGPDGAL